MKLWPPHSATDRAVNVLQRMCKLQKRVQCGQKTLLVLRTSDGTNLVKLVKCPKGGREMFHRKPIPSLGELRIVWKLSNLGPCIELCVRQRLLNKIRIRTRRAAQVQNHCIMLKHNCSSNNYIYQRQQHCKNVTRGNM